MTLAAVVIVGILVAIGCIVWVRRSASPGPGHPGASPSASRDSAIPRDPDGKLLRTPEHNRLDRFMP